MKDHLLIKTFLRVGILLTQQQYTCDWKNKQFSDKIIVLLHKNDFQHTYGHYVPHVKLRRSYEHFGARF